ncbi:MAG: Fic family protein [Coriobacteriales bacterium]|nr:Fic family protein [Coriobacteriales bacterium]
MSYIPPFNNTSKMIRLVAEIAESITQVEFSESLSPNPLLRRENRIKTIHSSLVIEANALTLDQVTAVLNGKHVLAPPKDIREVQNAYEAYDALQDMNPYSVDDLLKAHGIMMAGLVQDAGKFRSGNVGVFDGDTLIHAGTPARYVPEVIHDLFTWIRDAEDHPLIKSSVFHFEFEYIHPFSDGNGRTGRMWHSLLLRRWRPIFSWLPVETLVHRNQQAYYDALGDSEKTGDSTPFIELMLKIIDDTLKDVIDQQRRASKDGTNNGTKSGTNEMTASDILLELIRMNPQISVQEMCEQTEKSRRQVQRLLDSLKQAGKIERIGSPRNGYWKALS